MTIPDLPPSIVGLIAEGRFGEHHLDLRDISTLRWHGLSAEAAAQTEATGDDSSQAQALFRAARSDKVRSMAVLATAARVSAILHDAGLRVLCYKGPALAMQTSGVWSRRGSADADILIAEVDVIEAHKALTSEGMSPRNGQSRPPSRLLMYRDSERVYSGLPCSVDLHWRLEDSPAYCHLPFEELWSRHEAALIEDHRLDTLGRTDALLVTAVHGSRERWWKWRWALDAYRQLDAAPLAQWHEALGLTRRAGGMRALASALAVARICGLRRPDLPEPNARIAKLAAAWLTAPATHGAQSPLAALSRRIDRWRLADSPVRSLDGAARAAVRQLFSESRTFAPRA